MGSPETSVRNYDYSLRNNPEERRSQLLNCFDNTCKLRIFFFVMEMERVLCEKRAEGAGKETSTTSIIFFLLSVCLSVCLSRSLHTLHSLHITNHERATTILFPLISLNAV